MYEDVEIDEGPTGKVAAALARKWQHYLDISAPHTAPRWMLTGLVVLIYCLRVYLINGWYIITYGLGIYVLNLLIGFLSPQADPEMEGPTLPTSKDDEFRPVIRRLPEFKFWYSLTKAFCIAFVMTFCTRCRRRRGRRRRGHRRAYRARSRCGGCAGSAPRR